MKTAEYWNEILTDWLAQGLSPIELLKQVQIDAVTAAAVCAGDAGDLYHDLAMLALREDLKPTPKQ